MLSWRYYKTLVLEGFYIPYSLVGISNHQSVF